MKISIARGELLDALSVVSRGLSSRTTLPILSGIHVSTNEDTVVFQATDLEVSIKTSCKARVETPGNSVLPGKLLTDVVRSLPEAAVTVTTNEKRTAQVVCGQSSFSMKTLAPEDYPKFPEVNANQTISVPSEVFSHLVHQVSRSVSRDETRPILTGMLVMIEAGMLRMVATDSYRLCVGEVEVEGVGDDIELVVPGKAMEDVAKLAGSAESVSLGVSENQVIFTFGDTTFISRRIEGSFPNYRQLLPKEHSTRAVVDRVELLEAVKRVSLMAQHSTPLRVKISAAEHTLTLSAATQDVGDASEDIQVVPDGEDVEIAFNHAYLLDGVSVAEGDTVALEVSSPLKPGVLKPGKGDGFVYLLMPVRLG
ncbi:MAG: DNA polymerase III subunit beta [Coriobacteriia bacterium]|nr:DNA polymerase III subunit beta [Coriobacteriia bacterium]